MLMLHDPRCADYGASGHPEQPVRITKTVPFLRETHPDWRWQTPPESVSDETLLLAHTRAHLKRLEEPSDFDPDTAYFPNIATHARRAAASAVAAADHALRRSEPAFSLMRPPGHHATAHEAMGFCYLNHVAIAALHALTQSAIARVAVWDFDAHHGNGTEALVLGRPGCLFTSVHQSPGYPGTGLEDVSNCRNWPLPPHTPRIRHMGALRESFDAVLNFQPDLILVSAGFDAYVRDPITAMTLENEDFATLGAWLREAAIPAAAVLEGGYSPDLPELIDAFLNAWNG